LGITEIIDLIGELPHVRAFKCEHCGALNEAPSLEIYGTCTSCGDVSKLRSFGGRGSEVEEIVDVVLRWLYEDPNWRALVEERGKPRA
jgi:hypothetical protein